MQIIREELQMYKLCILLYLQMNSWDLIMKYFKLLLHFMIKLGKYGKDCIQSLRQSDYFLFLWVQMRKTCNQNMQRLIIIIMWQSLHRLYTV
jgi:hypothetical protein